MASGIAIAIKSNRFPQGASLMRKAVASAFNTAKGPLLADMQRRTPVDTGGLRNSETATVENETTLRLSAGAGLPDARALYVHQGTRRMAARPYMRGAVEAAEGQIAQAIVKAANDGLAA